MVIEFLISSSDVQSWLQLIVVGGAAFTIVFGFTPKGGPAIITIFSFLNKNFFNRDLYKKYDDHEKRIAELEEINNG